MSLIFNRLINYDKNGKYIRKRRRPENDSQLEGKLTSQRPEIKKTINNSVLE